MVVVRTRLRWFGFAVRREEDYIVRETVNFEVAERRAAGRLSKTWRQCVEKDMRRLNNEMVGDRKLWRGSYPIQHHRFWKGRT